MIRVCLPITMVLFLILSSFPLAGQSIAQVTAQSQPVSKGSGITAKYVNTPLAEALRDVAIRGRVKINFTPGKLPSNAQVTQEFINVTPEEVFRRLLQGTKLRVVQIATGEWVIAPAGEQKTIGQGVIAGQVTDARSGKGISGANVSIGNERGATTNEDGTYRLIGVASGTHSVIVRLVGYAKQSRTVAVGDGVTVSVDFKLEPSANVLDQVVVTGTVVATELKAVSSAITVVTAKQIEERGITRIEQLFRGDVPGLFATNRGSAASGTGLGHVFMFSRGATSFDQVAAGGNTNPIKTYVDGIELADPTLISKIDPRSIDRIEIISGPQASTIYGSGAINGVMQIFTKRGKSATPSMALTLLSGIIQSNFSPALAPQHDIGVQLNGVEGHWSYNVGTSYNYIGAWNPDARSGVFSGFGGGRLQYGTIGGDANFRWSGTKARQGGDWRQGRTHLLEAGMVTPIQAASDGYSGRVGEYVHSLHSRTAGGTLTFSPTGWWWSELGMGLDANYEDHAITRPGYGIVSDTMRGDNEISQTKLSKRFASTMQLDLSDVTRLNVTFGADHNIAQFRNFRFSSSSITGPIAIQSGSEQFVINPPVKSTGAFIQSQLHLWDTFFLTYGMRAEWNPAYGKIVQPYYAPRLGGVLARDFGWGTAKLRGSYGESTKPPASGLKEALTYTCCDGTYTSRIAYYGNQDLFLANPDLAPEFQKGGEGGLEFYVGSQGSLIITRYNQTVDGLILRPGGVADSVRSLVPAPPIYDVLGTDGYGYFYQRYGYLNIGSIRNQGWELQGSINTGPLTTKGTYSWTKSRFIGVTPAYRNLVGTGSSGEYAPGRAFSFLPEHTWAMEFRYSQPQLTMALNLTGNGQLYKSVDQLVMVNNSTRRPRLDTYRTRMGMPTSYRASMDGYMLADLTTSRWITNSLEAVLQVNNLLDRYRSDVSDVDVAMGRQIRTGIRLRNR